MQTYCDCKLHSQYCLISKLKIKNPDSCLHVEWSTSINHENYHKRRNRVQTTGQTSRRVIMLIAKVRYSEWNRSPQIWKCKYFWLPSKLYFIWTWLALKPVEWEGGRFQEKTDRCTLLGQWNGKLEKPASGRAAKSWEILRQILELQGHWGLVSGDRAPGFRSHVWDCSENPHTRAGLPTTASLRSVPLKPPSLVSLCDNQ